MPRHSPLVLRHAAASPRAPPYLRRRPLPAEIFTAAKLLKPTREELSMELRYGPGDKERQDSCD